MNLSARAYHRVLKPARTIADLAGAERIMPAHIARSVDRSILGSCDPVPAETDGMIQSALIKEVQR